MSCEEFSPLCECPGLVNRSQPDRHFSYPCNHLNAVRELAEEDCAVWKVVGRGRREGGGGRGEGRGERGEGERVRGEGRGERGGCEVGTHSVTVLVQMSKAVISSSQGVSVWPLQAY